MLAIWSGSPIGIRRGLSALSFSARKHGSEGGWTHRSRFARSLTLKCKQNLGAPVPDFSALDEFELLDAAFEGQAARLLDSATSDLSNNSIIERKVFTSPLGTGKSVDPTGGDGYKEKGSLDSVGKGNVGRRERGKKAIVGFSGNPEKNKGASGQGRRHPGSGGGERGASLGAVISNTSEGSATRKGGGLYGSGSPPLFLSQTGRTGWAGGLHGTTGSSVNGNWETGGTDLGWDAAKDKLNSGARSEQEKESKRGKKIAPTKAAAAMKGGGKKARVDPTAGEPGKGQDGEIHLSRHKTAYVQILGTGMDTGDTSPCVLLFFDRCRFLFNAGEGLQRLCIEYKVRLSRVDKVLLTRVSSETAAGLPGLLLTLANTGDTGLTVDVCGPSDLHLLARAMRCFVPHASIRTSSFGSPSCSLPLLPAPEGATRDPDTHSEGGAYLVHEDESVRITAVLLRAEGSSVDVGAVAMARRGAGVVYACQLPTVAGKFDPAAARRLGLRPGPKYRKLQEGSPVLADDGETLIQPSQVMEPPQPGPVLLVVDCPSPDLVGRVAASGHIAQFAGPRREGEPSVTCVLHFSPQPVLHSAEYQGWMATLGPQAHHMFLGSRSSQSCPILASSGRITAMLRHLAPYLFPAPPPETPAAAASEPPMDAVGGGEGQLVGPTVPATNLLRFNLRAGPKFGPDHNGLPVALPEEGAAERLEQKNPAALRAFEGVRQHWWGEGAAHEELLPHSGNGFLPSVSDLESAPLPPPSSSSAACGDHDASSALPAEPGSEGTRAGLSPGPARAPGQEGHADIPEGLRGVGRDEAEIVFLGTGSSQPSKYRNLSGIYVHRFGRGGMVLDCGEGTFKQLILRYGEAEAEEVLAGLRCIWISHIHADHHTGLVRLLAARRDLLAGRAERRERAAGPSPSGASQLPSGSDFAGSVPPILVIGPAQLKPYLDAYSSLEDLRFFFLDCRKTVDVGVARGVLGAPAGEEGGSDWSSSATGAEGSAGVEGVVGKRRREQEEQSRLGGRGLRPFALASLAMSEEEAEVLRGAMASLGLASLRSVPVVHCSEAFAVVLEGVPVGASHQESAKQELPGVDFGHSASLSSGGPPSRCWKVVYSGDTRPCRAVVEATRGATLLIHEATFEDDLEDEAVARRHSTTSEAIGVGKAAGAYRTILTHFSQRYPKLARVAKDASGSAETVCVAFDLMSVNLADLPKLPMLLPAFQSLFQGDTEEDEAEDSKQMQ